jgi:hypothetical protein
MRVSHFIVATAFAVVGASRGSTGIALFCGERELPRMDLQARLKIDLPASKRAAHLEPASIRGYTDHACRCKRSEVRCSIEAI